MTTPESIPVDKTTATGGLVLAITPMLGFYELWTILNPVVGDTLSSGVWQCWRLLDKWIGRVGVIILKVLVTALLLWLAWHWTWEPEFRDVRGGR